MKSLGQFVLCILVCLAIGFIGSIFVQGTLDTWYPLLNPPRGILSVHALKTLWTIFYIVLGLSLWFAIQNQAPKHAYALFGLQLMLNLLWIFFFFGMHSVFLGLIDMIFLLLITWITAELFWRTSKTAGFLLTSYLVWIVYITYLNFGFFLLNRGAADI